jgi:hypothetical protein
MTPTAIAVLAAVGILAAWRLSRCRHRGPLSLLPSLKHADGSTTPARWWCSRCDRSWPANVDLKPRTKSRFEGYDQTKAATAAKRAGELERKATAAAVARAGLTPRKRKTTKTLAPVLPMPKVGGR